MQIKSFEPGIEVFGPGASAWVEAFKLFPSVVLKRLVSHGIAAYRNGEIYIDRTAWYPLENWLAAFQDIADSLGPRALFQVGQNAPSFVVLPPTMTDIHSCMAGVNIGYHMNHRKNGRPMFDPEQGTLLAGIGDYGCTTVPGERRMIIRCDTPYPCDFDRGILLGFARRFEKTAEIEHMETAPCRKKGKDSCTYMVTW
jgi:hypothetical protein